LIDTVIKQKEKKKVVVEMLYKEEVEASYEIRI
jgi:hypothetical protein